MEVLTALVICYVISVIGTVVIVVAREIVSLFKEDVQLANSVNHRP